MGLGTRYCIWVLERDIVYGSWNEILYMGLETRYCIWVLKRDIVYGS